MFDLDATRPEEAHARGDAERERVMTFQCKP